MPALLADAGEQASWRYVEFFTANIRNPNTGRAYARACARFLAWCEQRGLTLLSIRPFDAAAGIGEDRKSVLFRTSRGRGGRVLSDLPAAQADAWSKVDPEIQTEI